MKLFHSCASHRTVWSICMSPVRYATGNELRWAQDSARDLLGLLREIFLPSPFSPLALATFLQSLHLPHLYILSLSVQNPPPRIHQSNVLVLGTSTRPSVTWCSWGAELRCVLLGMNWPHGVRGLFLDVNQQRGEFYDWNWQIVRNDYFGNVEKRPCEGKEDSDLEMCRKLKPWQESSLAKTGTSNWA